MAQDRISKIVSGLGFVSIREYLVKFAIPIFSVILIFAFVVKYFLTLLPSFFPYVLIVMGLVFVILYPYAIYQKKAVSINEKMHLMITYAGTLSTLDVQRNTLFRKLSEDNRFGEISKLTNRILYFAKSWNLGFSHASRRVAQSTPSKIFADFLDRFAVMMDFGQSFKIFLVDEQNAVMDDFESEYKKSLENIKMMQEVFVSLTIAIAFVMATALLLPIIAGVSIEFVVRVSLGGIVFVDLLLYTIVKVFIPSDRLCHSLPIKDEATKKLIRQFYILAPISLIITLVLLYLDFLPFLFNFAIGLTPLLYIGVMAQDVESKIYSRDLAFPSFIRALGSVVEIKMGAVVSSMRSLQVHDFGVLNDLVINLYRRLKLGNDKFKCWMYFAAESGSNLITNFSQIFADSVYLGGNAEKIGEIVSKNFQRLISLRKLRIQLASTVRGSFYGSLVGFASASYVSAKITEILAVLFTSPMSGMSQDDGGYMASVISSIAPPSAINIDFGQISIYIGVMIIIHCLVSSLIIKVVDGGNYYAAIFDLVIMLWIGAILSWLLPNLIERMMPDIESTFNVTDIED